MKRASRRVDSRLLILLLGISLFLPSAEARGRREKRKYTPEELIQACVSNPRGLEITVRNLLNEKRNPLAENVKAADWNKYCACYAPKAKEIEDARPKGNLGQAEYQKLVGELNSVSETCANNSIPAGKPAPVHHSPLKADSRFNATLQYCKKSPKGYLTNLEVHLKVRKSPRAAGVAKMNSDQYCECYVRSLRQRLGDDMALKELTTLSPAADKDLMKVSDAKDETYDTCAAEQIPFSQ